MNNETTMLSFFGNGKEKIPYDIQVAQITGSMKSAVLLQQMQYNWGRAGNKPFYKFKAPCSHKLYRLEDSWLEELGMKEYSFENALKSIGTRARTTDEIREFLGKTSMEFCVVYYIDRGNMTWYYLNEKAIAKVLRKAAELYAQRQARLVQGREHIADPLDPNYVDSSEAPTRKVETTYPITENTRDNNTKEFSYGKGEFEVKEKKKSAYKLGKQTNFQSDGVTLPLDFQITDDIMGDAQNLGYEHTDVLDEGRRFVHYYAKGKGKTLQQSDWNGYFLDFWLNNAYRKGKIRRNGKFYTQPDAPKSRSEQLRELLDPNMFAEVR